jgi:AcrR family transcriptional regulator
MLVGAETTGISPKLIDPALRQIRVNHGTPSFFFTLTNIVLDEQRTLRTTFVSSRIPCTVHHAKRSTRDRPAKAPLSEALIVDTAVGILRKDGLDAVTMRRVAAALDTGPASLYVYVDGRRGLRDAMLERVVASIPLEEPDPSRWREQVITLMKAMLRALQAHPGIARVVLIDRGLGRSFDPTIEPEEMVTLPPGRDSLRLIETLLGTIRAGGIDPLDAARACDVLSLITAAAATEIPTQGRDGPPKPAAEPGAVERVREALANLPHDRFPLVTQFGAEPRSVSGEERFSFAIETLLEGLVARRRGNG